jgi:hypothetical protein
VGSAAAAGPAANLRIQGCTAERTSDIEAAWLLELQSKSFLDSVACPIQLRLECHATRIRIEVTAAEGTRSLSREVDVSSVPRTAQGRLVAIAAAELSAPLRRGDSAAAEAEGSTKSQASPEAVVVAPPPPAPAPTSNRRLEVFADARRFSAQDPGWLAGAGVGFARGWASGWALGGDAVVDTASQELALGHETTMLLSARPLVTRGFGHGRARLALGAGARLALVRLAGEPKQAGVDGATLWGFEVGPALTVSGALRVSRGSSLSLLLEGGRAVGRTIGRQAGAAAIIVEGTWVGAQLGVGLSL